MLGFELSPFCVVYTDHYQEAEGLKGWGADQDQVASNAALSTATVPERQAERTQRWSPSSERVQIIKHVHGDEAGPGASCPSQDEVWWG